MVGVNKTVFNNGGVPMATSADEFYQRQSLANQSQSNEQARLAAMLQDAAANRALQLQTMGSFADRAGQAANMQNAGFAHDTSMEGLRGTNALAVGKQAGDFNIAGIREGNMPEFGRQAIHMKEYGDARDDNAANREFGNAVAEYKLNALKNRGGQPAPSVMGPLFADQGNAVEPGSLMRPASAFGNVFANAANGAPAAPATSQGGGVDDEFLRQILGMPSNRPSEQEGYNRKQVELARRAAPLQEAQKIAFQSGRVNEGIALGKQIDAIFGGNTDYSAVAAAYKPTAAESEAKATANATAASEGFDFKSSIAEIDSLAKDFRNGAAGKGEVLQKADELVKRLVQREIPEQQAKQLVGQQLDKTLPGLGRDILSGISSVAAAVVDPRVWVGARDPNANVGNASELRSDLKNSGYLR